MSEQITLRAELGRATGSRASRRIRAAGGVPGIVYGKGRDPLNVTLDHHDLMSIIAHHGTNALIALDTGKEKILTIPKVIGRHPYRNRIDHIDLVGVNLKEKVTTTVSVVLTGEPAGVREGGILTHGAHQLTIEALPTDIPAHIEVDVTTLEVGSSLRVADLAAAKAYEIIDDPETVIASVVTPAVEVAPEPVEGEEAATAADAAGETEETTAEGDAAE